MNKYVLMAAMAGSVIVAGAASATELWDPHLRGVNEGLAAGALPPKGFYFINDSYFLSYESTNDKGKKTGLKVDAYVDVPILLWSPGVKVLGADYALGIAQPFDNVSASSSTIKSGNAHWGTFNTILIPGALSWSLPNDFHLATSLAYYVDDASSSPAHPPSNGGLGSGNGYWTIEPTVGLSWLHDGWNLSADIHYDYNGKNGSTDYQSGDEIAIDYTATKTFGKWTVGIGAYTENQLQEDTKHGVKQAGSMVQNFGAGPIVGYAFEGISLQATYNHEIMTHNDVGGDFFNIRAVVPF